MSVASLALESKVVFPKYGKVIKFMAPSMIPVVWDCYRFRPQSASIIMTKTLNPVLPLQYPSFNRIFKLTAYISPYVMFHLHVSCRHPKGFFVKHSQSPLKSPWLGMAGPTHRGRLAFTGTHQSGQAQSIGRN